MDNNKPPAKPEPKQPDKDPVPVVRPAGTTAVQDADLEPLDHVTKRAFQTSAEPGQREFLTEDEAKKKGLHWAKNPKDKDKKKKS
jgi:hypothetical protein